MGFFIDKFSGTFFIARDPVEFRKLHDTYQEVYDSCRSMSSPNAVSLQRRGLAGILIASRETAIAPTLFTRLSKISIGTRVVKQNELMAIMDSIDGFDIVGGKRSLYTYVRANKRI